MTLARTIAIGDIHGCSAALAALIDAIKPRPDDVIVRCGTTSTVARTLGA